MWLLTILIAQVYLVTILQGEAIDYVLREVGKIHRGKADLFGMCFYLDFEIYPNKGHSSYLFLAHFYQKELHQRWILSL